MKVIHIIMIISFLFISQVSFADYSSVVVLSFSKNSTRYKLPESECINIGVEAAKNIGIIKNHQSRGVGTVIAGTDNKGSFLQIYCLAKTRVTKLTHTIVIIMNSSNKVTRDNLVKKYKEEFKKIMKKRFGITSSSATGPSTF